MSSLAVRAFPVVLAAPSGTGKTTIARALVRSSEAFVFSVSATTRPRRKDEENGVDYHFLTEEEFQGMVDAGDMVEWARVHGHLYGTPRRNLEEAATRGEHVVLDIDVQGARQLRARVPDAILVFVFPPSAEALVRRLRSRGTEQEGEVRRRLGAAQEELAEATDFDYVVVNDDLDGAVEEVRGIVQAERHRPKAASDLEARVAALRGDIERIVKESLAPAEG